MSYRFIMASIMVIIFILTVVLFGEIKKPVNPRVQHPGIEFYEIPLIDFMNIIQPFRFLQINPRNVGRPPRSIKKDRKRPKKYYTDLEEHANDPQNAHDHQVIIGLKEKYDRLLELHEDGAEIEDLKKAGLTERELIDAKIMDSINEIYQYAVRTLNLENKNKVEEVLTAIARGNIVTSFDPNGVKESWILSLIWERINHPDNKEQCENMKEALMHQLIDCIQTTQEMLGDMVQLIAPLGDTPHVVCVNGRVARILSTLSLLDNDPILRKPELDEREISNLAFMKASSVLQKNLKRKVPKGRGYDNLEGILLEDVYIKDPDKLTDDEQRLLKQFESYVKKEIEHTLRKEYQDIVSTKLLTEIINKAQMGV